MIKPGFSLIEFLIASLISGMLSVILFASLMQVNRSVTRVDEVASMYSGAGIMHNQFEWDISGAFVPYLGQPEKSEEHKEQPAQDKSQPQAKDQQKSEGKKEQKTEEKKKKLAKVFYGVGADKNFELTFITSNPMQVYWSANVGRAKPRVTRIRYFAKEDKEHPGSFMVMRQESDDLDAAVLGKSGEEKVRAYVLAEQIKEIKVEYVLRKEKKTEGEKSPSGTASEGAKAKAPEFEYVVLKEWNIEKESDDETAKLMKNAVVPHSVRISWSVWNPTHSRSENFSCIISVLADSKPIKKQKDAQPTAQQKTQQPGVQKNALAADGRSVEDRYGITQLRQQREQHTMNLADGPHISRVRLR